jgi:predicted permease
MNKYKSRIYAAFRNIFSSEKLNRDLDAEVRSYTNLLEEEKMSTGMNANEAKRTTRIAIIGPEQLKEEIRSARSGAWLETFWQDFRFGARTLRKSPGFAAAAIFTLAIGIGANTAIFSAVYAVLLKPLPFKNSESLVAISKKNPPRGWMRNSISPAEFLAWRDASRAFEEMAIFGGSSCVLTGQGEPEQDPCEIVSSNLFPLLGVSPIRGRGFISDEDKGDSAPAAILSHGLWQRRFGADENIVGRHVTLNGASYEIVGVMPESFSHLYATPYSSIPQLWLSKIGLSRTNISNDYFGIGRLRPGASIEQAETELNPVSIGLDQTYPPLKGWRAQMISLRIVDSGDARVPLLILMGAVIFVLLIACANVANLLLARGAGRAAEFAVRKALGAGQGRLARQLLTEAMLISVLGGTLGVIFAAWGNRLLTALAPPFLFKIAPGLANASLNFRVLAFALSVAVGTTLLFGLAPAIQATRSRHVEALKESGRGALQSPQSRVFRATLVVTEIALAMVLLVGAGLMIRTLANISHVNLGINPTNVLTMRVPLPGQHYKDPQTRADFWTRVVSSVQSLPGVESATVSRGLPIGDWAGQFFVTFENQNPPAGQTPDANYIVAGPDYFRVTGIPIRAGRSFNDRDTQTADRAVIVNEELARVNWPGQNPLGKRLRMGSSASSRPWLTVVGVVGNVRSQGPDENIHSEIYVPYEQFPWMLPPDYLLVRSSAAVNPSSLTSAILNEIHRVNKDQPASEIQMLEHAVESSIALESWMMGLLKLFACLALILSTVGTYSVLAYSVAQRTREIGIRVALGAQRRIVLRMIIGSGARLAALGITAGIAAAIALTHFMNDFLFGVRATDPFTIVVVAIAISASSFLACYIPARRATRVDPIVALRYE